MLLQAGWKFSRFKAYSTRSIIAKKTYASQYRNNSSSNYSFVQASIPATTSIIAVAQALAISAEDIQVSKGQLINTCKQNSFVQLTLQVKEIVYLKPSLSVYTDTKTITSNFDDYLLTTFMGNIMPSHISTVLPYVSAPQTFIVDGYN